MTEPLEFEVVMSDTVAPEAVVPVDASSATTATTATSSTSPTGKTGTFSTWADLPDELKRAMMFGIGQTICNHMKHSMDEVKKMNDEARARSGG